MFRAAMYPSAGKLIVSIQHLVYVTPYGWPFDVQDWMRLSTPFIILRKQNKSILCGQNVEFLNVNACSYMKQPRGFEGSNKTEIGWPIWIEVSKSFKLTFIVARRIQTKWQTDRRGDITTRISIYYVSNAPKINSLEKTHMNLKVHKSLTLRRLMSYIYGAPILDVSRSHTTTQHSR